MNDFYLPPMLVIHDYSEETSPQKRGVSGTDNSYVDDKDFE